MLIAQINIDLKHDYLIKIRKLIEKKELNKGLQIEVLNNFSKTLEQKQKPFEICKELIEESQNSVKVKLLKENQDMRNTLITLHAEIQEIISVQKSDYMKQNGGMSAEEFNQIQPVLMKKEIFLLPYDQIGSEIIKLFRDNFQNLNKFMSFMIKNPKQQNIMDETFGIDLDSNLILKSAFKNDCIEQNTKGDENYDKIFGQDHQACGNMLFKYQESFLLDEVTTNQNQHIEFHQKLKKWERHFNTKTVQE